MKNTFTAYAVADYYVCLYKEGKGYRCQVCDSNFFLVSEGTCMEMDDTSVLIRDLLLDEGILASCRPEQIDPDWLSRNMEQAVLLQQTICSFKQNSCTILSKGRNQDAEDLEFLVTNALVAFIQEKELPVSVSELVLLDSTDPDSLEVLVEYAGNVKEYAMHHALSSLDLDIDSLKIHFHPIRRSESGSMGDYILRILYREEQNKEADLLEDPGIQWPWCR